MSKTLTLKDLKAAKYNPRTITTQALKRLDKSISEFGDLSGVVFNETTGTLISGHQRITTIKDKKTKVVTTKHKDKHGTVAVGHIEVEDNGKEIRIPFRVVAWDKRKEKLANIAANAHGGEFDNQKLGKLLAELNTDKFDIELSGFSDIEVKNLVRKSDSLKPSEQYTRKLGSPIYKVTGKKPPLSEVFDTTKTKELESAIKKAKLPADIEAFLIAAAQRHTKFNFSKAAEYYAHADKKVQALMEDTALVIVDYDKAIEHGYVKLTSDILGMAADENEAKED